MERLIVKTATGGYSQNNAGDLWKVNGSKLINKRLYEYEHTGLTPADIAAMQAENKRLQGEVNAQHAETKALKEQFEQALVLSNKLGNDLDAYRKAEAEGTLVRVPCRAGDIVYSYCDTFNRIGKYKIDMVQLYGHDSISFCASWNEHGELMDDLDFDAEDIGKTVFLTEDSARAALK